LPPALIGHYHPATVSHGWDDPTKRPLLFEDAATSSIRTLEVVGPAATRRILLSRGQKVHLGRDVESEVPLEDGLASRRHALLEVGDQVLVTDLGSANGTKVDGQPLVPNQPRTLGPDQVLEIGSTVAYLRSAGVGGTTELLEAVDRVANSHLSVLLMGESGVGKEVLANRIHEKSPRARRPLIKVNCASLVDALLEAELFGYEEGAFTGATKAKRGLLEEAHGGSFFLDEVAELPPVTQTKLLRVLETGQSQRLGALAPTDLDLRFLAATNRDLPALVRAGEFRQDLFFRLEGYVVQVPPLRQRREEIVPLAEAFILETCKKLDRPPPKLATTAALRLLRYGWPGNVRELRNVIARSVVLTGGPALEAEHLQFAEVGISKPEAPAQRSRAPGRATDREAILAALTAAGGNQKKAATTLGVSVRTLQNRMDELAIPRPRK
jgi:two-component system response regulator AtoC